MVFGEKLQQLRKKNGMSQEQLAAQITVSRQAVSKWELGESIPDTENILQLSELFKVSIDYLLKSNINEEPASKTNNTGGTPRIAIISKMEAGKMSSFYKFTISRAVGKKEHHPEAMLMGIDSNDFWGENSVCLAWYRTKEDAERELREILDAIANGQATYDLRYFVDTKRKGIFDFEII